MPVRFVFCLLSEGHWRRQKSAARCCFSIKLTGRVSAGGRHSPNGAIAGFTFYMQQSVFSFFISVKMLEKN